MENVRAMTHPVKISYAEDTNDQQHPCHEEPIRDLLHGVAIYFSKHPCGPEGDDNEQVELVCSLAYPSLAKLIILPRAASLHPLLFGVVAATLCRCSCQCAKTVLQSEPDHAGQLADLKHFAAPIIVHTHGSVCYSLLHLLVAVGCLCPVWYIYAWHRAHNYNTKQHP